MPNTQNKRDEMIGGRFGRLTVLGEAPQTTSSREQAYLVECDCTPGRRFVVSSGYRLRSGRTTSCGCVRAEAARRTIVRNSPVARFRAAYLEALRQVWPKGYEALVLSIETMGRSAA